MPEALAINGGNPAIPNPLPGWPVYERDEIEAVSRVLASGRVNQWTGPEVKAFESAFAEYHDVPHAIAVANGTLALELALVAIGLEPGDEVIVPACTFIATASAVVARGGVPVVADLDSEHQHVTPDTIQAALSPRTRAIIVVHLNGWPCDMQPIMALARSHNLRVIEDCAQAVGACRGGQAVGTVADLGAFSFCQDKIMTTGGEGGMLLTRDEDLWQRAWEYKDHGKSHHAVFHAEHPPGFRWVHGSWGSNWRMTGMQAAIGLCQLRKLDSWLDRRREHAARLTAGLAAHTAFRIPWTGADAEHAAYRLATYVQPEGLAEGWNRDRLLEALRMEGIPCLQGCCPDIQREAAFDREERPVPQATRLGEESIVFLTHPTLGAEDMDTVLQAVAKVVAVAGR